MSTSQKQIDANRQNAQKSTGPKSRQHLRAGKHRRAKSKFEHSNPFPGKPR